ncbi:aspartate carbamoyltransferase [Gammaproteobacteria bacterium 45_16_T64]|nr:aspartate carbamoyltransferase [Gammaproteobacteria bacterium 45_16_T64]
MFAMRPDEQEYALLSDNDIHDSNRYGQKIDMIDLVSGELPVNRSMYINDNPEVGTNPNRNKQHGFHFTADNCIGCHACESACSEKNDLPPHISFRSVGYVEGGTYPAYKRMNISMACNHCDDPVCLKGCPTRAYTKHAEYGAVLQDPETCFGCGYCTWVCPYNAPQLDPVKGQVSKCNMCVDRLEVGLKPACVSACLGNALNFGVIENTPDQREQTQTTIPGFPTTEITHPNIRFQQIDDMPDEVNRTDSMPIKYRKDEHGDFQTIVDEKQDHEAFWNLDRLSSRENPLVLFTLGTQAVIGAFILLFLGDMFQLPVITQLTESSLYLPMIGLLIGIEALGLFMSTIHLGKPIRFYRGFNNLRYSPLSREALGVAMFFAGMAGHAFFSLFDHGVFNWWDENAVANLVPWVPVSLTEGLAQGFGMFGIVAAVIGIYFMNRIYRIPARPFWNHWQVATAFGGSVISLGAVLTGLVFIPALAIMGESWNSLAILLSILLVNGLAIEGIGLYFHARYLNAETSEAAASHYIQKTTFGKTYMLRNCLIAINIAAVIMLAYSGIDGLLAYALWAIVAASVLFSSLIGRALFYVLVIPTTMPGAFFWKNKAFEQHARDIGLANRPQTGVAPDLH